MDTNERSGLALEEKDIAEKALQLLSSKLPPRWELETQHGAGSNQDLLLSFRNPSGSAKAVILEVKKSLIPRAALELLGGLGRRVGKTAGNAPIVVAAPYLSPRTRDLLTEQELGYVDLTGNIRIAFDYPGLLIEAQGAQRDPTPRVRPRRGLAGAMVGKIVRVLIDAKPPYRVMDIAQAAKVSPGYTSRVLEVLDREALIERDSRGPVEEVRWPELLRRRSESADLFERGSTSTFIATGGTAPALRQLTAITVGSNWAVTGSFAAARIAQIAAPTLLVIYSMDPPVLAERLALLPAEQGSDVAIVRPRNRGVFLGVVPEEDGLNWVATSQIAIDCLSGTGRMPAEGEAVVEWMTNNIETWRAASIEELVANWQNSRWD